MYCNREKHDLRWGGMGGGGTATSLSFSITQVSYADRRAHPSLKIQQPITVGLVDGVRQPENTTPVYKYVQSTETWVPILR